MDLLSDVIESKIESVERRFAVLSEKERKRFSVMESVDDLISDGQVGKGTYHGVDIYAAERDQGYMKYYDIAKDRYIIITTKKVSHTTAFTFSSNYTDK